MEEEGWQEKVKHSAKPAPLKNQLSSAVSNDTCPVLKLHVGGSRSREGVALVAVADPK
jgi:hypothetical protein